MLAAFDPSTSRFGYACGGEKDRAPVSGVWQLPGAADGVLDRSLGMISENVTNFLVVTKATHVVIERAIPFMPMRFDKKTGEPIGQSNSHTIAALLQAYGVVRAASYRAKCHVVLPTRQSTLKIFCGEAKKGRDFAKDEVMSMCDALGWKYADDNAADACALWAYGLHHFFRRPVHPLLNRVVGGT